MGSHLRTGQIHLDHISPGFVHQPGKLLPVLLIGPHNRSDKDFIRKLLFQPFQICQIFLQGMFGDLLHVFKAHKGSPLFIQLVKTGRHLINHKMLRSYGLEHHAAPAGFICFFTHIIAVSHR